MTSPTPFQLLPRLTDEEFTALREDIRENGIRVPIDVDEDGVILDGHHRSWIAAELGVNVPRRIVAGLDDQGKRNHARAVNAIRRHLTRDQRRDQVGQMRAEGQTIEAISTTLGVPKSTVGRDLDELSHLGKLTAPESVKGADGKDYPTSYTRKEKTTVEESMTVDPATGELLDDEPAPADSKTYPKPEQRTERRRSLVDDAYKANTDLWKAVERIREITRDDRYSRNKADILAALQPSVDLALEVLTSLASPDERN